MDKEEILRRAQNQTGTDEMETRVIQKGSEFAMWAGLVAALGLMLCKKLAGQPWQDIYCLYVVMLAVLNLYKGVKLRQKHHIISGCVCVVMAALLLATYLMKIFR